MRNQTKNIITMTILVTSMFATEFQLKSVQRGHKILTFTPQEINIESKDGFTRLTTPEKGSTVDEGMPELPVFTSFFQMDAGISYSVSYTVVSSHVIEDVAIYPYQGNPVIGVERPFLKNIIKQYECDNIEVYLEAYNEHDFKKFSKDIDIFINTSYMDGFPYTFLEFLSKNIPIISSNVGGIDSMIVPGKNGDLFNFKG